MTPACTTIATADALVDLGTSLIWLAIAVVILLFVRRKLS